MKGPQVFWDEQERFARRTAAVFPSFVVGAALVAAGVGVVTGDETCSRGALLILAVGVGSVVLWVVAAVPMMLILIGTISVLERVRYWKK